MHALDDESEPHLLQEMAIEVAALSRPPAPAADPDRRVRPQRPAAGHARARPAATACTPSGATTSTTPLHVALTGETSGYYADFAPLSALAKVCERGFFHDGT